MFTAAGRVHQTSTLRTFSDCLTTVFTGEMSKYWWR